MTHPHLEPCDPLDCPTHETPATEPTPILEQLEDSACTCHRVEDPWTYYGIVEPGGALEPDPDCPEHFPAGSPTWHDSGGTPQ